MVVAPTSNPWFVNKQFSHVDRAPDPAAFVQHLELVASLDFVRDYKRRMVAALAVREGDQVLDVGCGIGADVRALAALVGASGRAVGVDSSATMIAEARRRTPGDVRAEFALGDCDRLEFATDTFDGCQADRVLHHVARPGRALRELARLVRPGGRVVVAEPDFDTLLVDAPDRAATRAILHHFCDGMADGWAGRHLPALFQDAGLGDIAVTPETVVLTDAALASRVLSLQQSAAAARLAEVVSAEAADRWVAQLAEAGRCGRFFASITIFVVSGRKR